MTRRLLVVCTANVCRSPVVERLLRRRLEHAVDVDGEKWEVGSAGTAQINAEVDRATRAAAARFGLDLSDHIRRRLDRSLLAEERPDLVITMAREHLRTVAAADPTLWPRTFTLKELARKAETRSTGRPTSFEDWVTTMSAGRKAADMMTPDPDDDVSDPYGGSRRGYEEMVAETAEAVDIIVRHGPWPEAGD